MPIYEFRCTDCGKRFQSLFGMTAQPDDAACPHCGAQKGEKLVSRFQRVRGEDDRIDEMADRMELLGDDESPSAMREMVREVGKALDDDVADDLEEMYEADQSSQVDDLD